MRIIYHIISISRVLFRYIDINFKLNFPSLLSTLALFPSSRGFMLYSLFQEIGVCVSVVRHRAGFKISRK